MRIERWQVMMMIATLAMFGRPGGRSSTETAEARATSGPVKLALTFDDGPKPEGTRRILEILRSRGVRATFFIVGKMAAKNPELLREITGAGHEVANHTYHHRDLTMLSTGEIVTELEWTRALIREQTGRDTRYFRPPSGRYNDRVVSIARALGYTMVMWDYYPRDYGGRSAASILRTLERQVQGPGIILLHNGLPMTMAALPRAIDDFLARGCEFVTVSELLGGEVASVQRTPTHRALPGA